MRDRPLIAVFDYGIGNLRSAQKALERVGADARLTADRALVDAADAVVLPGVGNFGACMDAVDSSGVSTLACAAVERGVPFLGICVGMQLLFEGSEEVPGRAGLGILPGVVRRLPSGVKHPQMQWNTLQVRHGSPLFERLADPAWMYFVHSFAPEDSPATVATCDYGGPVVAAVAHDNVMATQFHPEKSGWDGLALLANFVSMVVAARGSGRTCRR